MKYLTFEFKHLRDAEMRVLRRWSYFCVPSFTAFMGNRRYHLFVVKVNQ